MAKIQPKYSVDQRQAVGLAQLGGKTARQAIDLAAAGELEHGGRRLEPFAMPISSARYYARVERKRREAAGARPTSRDPAVRMRRLVDMGFAALDGDMQRLRRMKAADPRRADGIAKVAKAAAELYRLDRSIPSKPGPEKNGADPETPAEEAGPERDIAELVDEARQREAEHDDATPEGQASGLQDGTGSEAGPSGDAERNGTDTPTLEAGTPARSGRQSANARGGGARGIGPRSRVQTGDLARSRQ